MASMGSALTLLIKVIIEVTELFAQVPLGDLSCLITSGVCYEPILTVPFKKSNQPFMCLGALSPSCTVEHLGSGYGSVPTPHCPGLVRSRPGLRKALGLR